jgi:hypothetical protein
MTALLTSMDVLPPSFEHRACQRLSTKHTASGNVGCATIVPAVALAVAAHVAPPSSLRYSVLAGK